MTKIKPDTLIKLFKTAHYVRAVEQVIADNYNNGLMRCPTHLSLGQELIPAIINVFKDNKDLAVSTHRAHGHYLGKGGSLDRFFDELHGLPSGCSSGNGGSMHLIDMSVGFMGSTAIVGNTIPVGVGLSNSLKLDKVNNFVYIFLGDGATEEGIFYESLHYAKLNSLPCFFIIENNEFSVYTHIKDRQFNKLRERIDGFNVQYFFNDNNDYCKLYWDFRKAIEKIRLGEGPIVFEIMTHRYREHCGPNFDDQLNYRSKNFIEKWNSIDIIELLEEDLLNSNYEKDKIINMKTNINEIVNKSYFRSRELRIKQNEK